MPKAIHGFALGRPVVIPFPASGEEPVYTAQATLGKEQVSFSLGTGDELVAKERNAIADQYMERLFSTLEAQKASGGAGGVSLTAKQCKALAGQWYMAFVATHEDDPPAMETLRVFTQHMDNNENVVSFDDEGRPHYDVGLIRFIRKEVLVPHGLAEPDVPTWAKLAEAVVRTIRQGLATVKRYAEGDYSPDQVPNTFPVLDLSAVRQSASMLEEKKPVSSRRGSKAITFDDLLSQWWAAVQPTGITLSTYTAYQAAFRAFARYVRHDEAQRITTADVEGFRDTRLAEGRAHNTVNTQQEAIKSVYGWAVERKILNINPAKGVTMPKRRQVVTEDRDFTEGEARAILKAASAVRIPARNKINGRQVKAALVRRWLPWLCAYTGARAGEIAQLRTQDIRQDAQGGWIINITPEAGTVKTKHFREVPLHLHLIEQGFTRFVQGSPEGYLFLDVSLDADEDAKASARSSVIKGLAPFARKAGNLPKGRQPNHAWRHTFKTKGREAGISEHTLDAICGHTPNTVGGSYGKVSLKVKREAIDRLPRWEPL